LMENTEIIPHVPHDEVQKLQQTSQVLLLLVNNTPNAKGILTGKLYEYMASGRPILCIGPEVSDMANLLKETHTGQIVDFDNKEKLKQAIEELYNKYLVQGLAFNENKLIKNYSRKALAREYSTLLEKI